MKEGLPLRDPREPWLTELRTRFPDWNTDSANHRWGSVRASLRIGQVISGEVVARAPFGVWLDIGASFPALLLVPNMSAARLKRIRFEEYPDIGTIVEGRINTMGNCGEIGVTQLDSDFNDRR